MKKEKRVNNELDPKSANKKGCLPVLIVLIVVLIIVVLIFTIGGKSDNKDKVSKSGTYDLGDISVTYSDSVRNDVTENLRLSKVATDVDITNYALEYYNMFFASDNEVHAVINFTLNTTAKLTMLTSDTMDISVMEYVDGEEHDANQLFSGLLLNEYQLTISTGDITEIQ